MLGPELRFVERTKVIYKGKKYTFFGGNDYHRLSSHPDVVAAFCDTARRNGLSSAGSRATTGNHPVYGALERKLADFFGAEAAAVFANGYLANLILLQAIGEAFQRFFIDGAAHSSITDAAAILPPERVHRFRHADPEDLQTQLQAVSKSGERPLVLVDGVCSGSGELAPLAAYHRLVQERGGKLLVDDAHGVAVLGSTGKGSVEAAGLPPASYFQTGTLSKGFGVSGGFIAGSHAIIEGIHEKSLAFIGSTGMSIPLAAAGIKAVEILQARPELITGLQARMPAVKKRVRAMGLTIPDSPAPILSVTFRNETRNLKLRDALLAQSIYPPFIHYPGSPPGGHFRFTFSSAHTDEEVERLLGVLEG